jgi:outer membrane lipoprotein-sorting protein
VSPSTITSGRTATVSGTAAPGSTLALFAYSRPSTSYRTIRTGTAGSDGTFSWTVQPQTNTRFYVSSTDATGTSKSQTVALPVRTALSLTITRTGTRTYRFSGSVLPRVAKQLVTVYRGSTRAVQVRTAANGTYSVTRTFTGTGTFTFHAGTAANTNNAAGSSAPKRVSVR